MAYVKTNWTEATPITAQLLNKMENGIASVETAANTALNTKLDKTGGTITGNLKVNGEFTVGANMGLTSNKMYVGCGNGDAEGHIEMNVPGTHSAGLYGNTGSIGIYDWTNAQSILRYDRTTKQVTIGTDYTFQKPLRATSTAHFENNVYVDQAGDTSNIYLRKAGAARALIRSLNNGTGAEWHVYNAEGAWANNMVLSSEAGKALINNKRVATFDGASPSHNMFRYGAGMAGASGYITFSY